MEKKAARRKPKLQHDASPINPLPPVVVAIALAIVGIELVFQAGARGYLGGPEAVGWRITIIQDYGFFDPVFEVMRRNGELSFDGLKRFLTYAFVHEGGHQAIFAAVLALALGNYVSGLFSPVAVAAAFLISAAGGAFAYGLLLDPRQPLLGAFPGIYGMMGLYSWMLWVAADELGQNRWTAFRLVGFLIAIQCAFLVFGGGYERIVSDLGGFATGFLLATPLAPGGLKRLRAHLRG